MIHRYWRQSRFWAWWWRNRVSAEAKFVTAALLLIGLGAGGFLAAGGLSAAASDADGEVLQTQVVLRTTTIREQATGTRTVTIPGVERVSRRTVTTPGGTQVITERQEGPTLRRQVVATRAPVRTVTATVSGRTRTHVVTAQRVVTSERMVTEERTVEQRVTTTRVVTERVPVTQTQTVSSTETVTLSPVTVTEQIPVTVTVPKPKP